MIRFAAAFAAIAFAAAVHAHDTAFGVAVNPARAARAIVIDMSDAMRFVPSLIEVKRGENVKFVVSNSGTLEHEFVLGTMRELQEHADMMKKHPHMQHDDPHAIRLGAGKRGEIGWRFTQPGEFYFGCLVPGHFEAGMVGKVVVK